MQGVSAGERMDSTVRKAVELGVAEVQPVLAARSVARPKGERADSRRAHWQKVVIAACEQCGRNRIPEVHPLVAARGLPAAGDGDEDPAFAAVAAPVLEGCLATGSDIRPGRGAGSGIHGRRGGAAGRAPASCPPSLGPRVLRTETAAVAALAALNALRGDS